VLLASRSLGLLTGLLLLSSSAGVAVAPPAAAMGSGQAARATVSTTGSLVFVRGGNVWISRPDGSGARPVTREGTAADPYRTPTQDDQGRIYALRGHGVQAMVHRLDQQGRQLGTYRVPVPSLGPGFVSVSPDGTTLAYETMFAGTDCSFTPCHTFFQHAVEYAVATTGKVLGGAHGVQDADFASWAGNGRTVLQTRRLNVVALHRPGEPKAVDWFASCLSYQEGCEDTDVLNFTPAVNRQGSRLAVSHLEDTNGEKAAYLLVLSTTGATTGNPPAVPGAGCAHPVAAPTADFPGWTDLTLSAPSFSPDGSTVAFAELRAGRWTTELYTPVIGDCAASDPVAVLSDAAEPHWSAAPLTPPGKDVVSWTKAKHLKLKGKAKVGQVLKPALKKKAIRKGFKPHATKLRFQWLRNGHPIKKATKATYRIHKADRHKRLKLRITGIGKGHVIATVTTRAKRIK
jgi:hypothetical protein